MQSRERLSPHPGGRLLSLLLPVLCALAVAGEPAAAPSGYAVAAGDLLEIQVFSHPELQTRIRVGADGVFAFPLVGRVSGILGLRDVQLAEELARLLKDGFLPQATVSVVALELAPRRAHVLGGVLRQGLIELSPYVPLSASQGIAECGGFSTDADQAGVRVLRPSPSAGGGGAEILAVPTAEEVAAGRQSPVLRAGDLVVVPRQQAQRRAHILGSVMRQGLVELSPDRPLSASQGIAECGGFSEDADQAGVRVLRPSAAGAVAEVLAVPTPAEVAQGRQGPMLCAGDLVVVPRRDRVFVLGRVAHPGPVALRSQELMTVSKAISMAGGFEKFALKDEVQILRSGEAPRRIDVESYLRGTSSDDPELRNGDSIFIPESRF